MSTTKLSSVTEKEDCNSSTSGTGGSGSALVPVSSVKSRPTTVRASKWGRLLGSSSLDSGSDAQGTNAPAPNRTASTTGNTLNHSRTSKLQAKPSTTFIFSAFGSSS